MLKIVLEEAIAPNKLECRWLRTISIAATSLLLQVPSDDSKKPKKAKEDNLITKKSRLITA
jgi:hypothetical protein